MDYNLTLFKDSVRDILLMPTNNNNAAGNSGTDSKGQTINSLDPNQIIGGMSNLSFSNGENGESGFILGGGIIR